MSTVLLTGVGGLGGWALEFLARAPGVDRIVTIKRSPWSGPSRVSLARLGAMFQGHAKRFEHHMLDLADADASARLLASLKPDAILHSATVQSPRRFMNADIDDGLRAEVRAATFSLWLPWHLMPATQLVRAVERAGIETFIVNTAFPDVVNAAIRARFGHGPVAGAGNVEVSAAAVAGYTMEVSGAADEDIVVRLVGSHALMAYGASLVPHRFQLIVRGEDVTADYDLGAILASWPEAIAWNQTDCFSLFAASAVKNVMALLGSTQVRTHVSGPTGLPGGYPAKVSAGRIELDLPAGVSLEEAVATNEAAARYDAIERIEADGTVVYTGEARAAMESIGYHCEAVTFDELPRRCRLLLDLFGRLTSRN